MAKSDSPHPSELIHQHNPTLSALVNRHWQRCVQNMLHVLVINWLQGGCPCTESEDDNQHANHTGCLLTWHHN